jgi:signal transduction histidine kinase
MKKQIWIATVLYTLSIVSILGVLYMLLISNIPPLLTTMFIFILALGFGYTLSSYVLSQKFKVDENLLHLTKEILHELNIPISTIQANTALLKRTLKENEKGLKRLSRIDASTSRLNRLYIELVYSIKKEIHSIEKEEFLLEELVLERVEAMKLLNRNPFVLKLESHRVYVDKIGFEKVLDNLISNAMKYSDKSETIEIVLKENSLKIIDHGIGMDETELITIYERYYQLDNTSYGEGIGLALVKAYCDDEKIKIRINSKKEKGTKVTLDLNFIVL